MESLADRFDIVIGVDTGKVHHVAALLDVATAGKRARARVAAEPQGYQELFDKACSLSGRRWWAIEGCGSYGRGLARFLVERGEFVEEIDRPKRAKRRMGRKTDDIDAVRAAREALERDKHASPRGFGRRDALAAADVARQGALQAATDSERQLLSLAITAPEELASKLRGKDTARVVTICAKWRPDCCIDPVTRSIAATMRTIARRAIELRREADEHEHNISGIVQAWRPDLLGEIGVGAITAGVLLCAWSHPGRIRNEAAFALLSGCAPIDVSTGITDRQRLNRYGDRRLNWAIHVVAMHRARHHTRTKAYIARRTNEGKHPRDIRRCLKRYIARDLYRILEKGLDDQ